MVTNLAGVTSDACPYSLVARSGLIYRWSPTMLGRSRQTFDPPGGHAGLVAFCSGNIARSGHGAGGSDTGPVRACGSSRELSRRRRARRGSRGVRWAAEQRHSYRQTKALAKGADREVLEQRIGPRLGRLAVCTRRALCGPWEGKNFFVFFFYDGSQKRTSHTSESTG